VEVSPTADTTYKLTVQGADGKTVTQELKVMVGAAQARLVNVTVSALEVTAGELVSLCYTVENARAVTVDPIGFRAGSAGKGCAKDQPCAQGFEVAEQDLLKVGPFGAGQCRLRWSGRILGARTTAERQHQRGGYVLDSRQRTQPGLDFAQQLQAALLLSQLLVPSREEGQDAVRAVAGIDAAQFEEAAKHQARADEQHKR
jgi:hypothetical protein